MNDTLVQNINYLGPSQKIWIHAIQSRIKFAPKCTSKKTLLTCRLQHSSVHPDWLRWWDATTACQNAWPGKGHTTLSRTRNRKILLIYNNENNDHNQNIMQKILNEVPQYRSRGHCTVLCTVAPSTGGWPAERAPSAADGGPAGAGSWPARPSQLLFLLPASCH